jgi:hypothetical protein
MTTADIKLEIETKRAGTEYNIWRIGLTDDLVDRKKYWKETENLIVAYWSDWKADSLSDAQDIEAHFIRKGMKGGTDGDLSPQKPTFVYVF